ncbi:hypothetical protein ZYGR_0AK05750 [Zygosaccharomyces rouxii]|uniref:DUF676 domain-containing protein n=1 Tax=Zygosaccharomyces rouxii TaxID=4956 RepID=A0A1Q3AF22_ZYGRO|nr:hypothetical protein ZYGR_0AK05750 [Zygosaccharomyces rouxii]
MSSDLLLYTDRQEVGIGDVYRYRFTVDVSQLPPGTQELCLRIKNVESPLLRPIYMSGPYSVYVDVRPCKYDEDKPWEETMQFCCDLRPDEHFHAKLLINENSLLEGSKHSWTVDILSQICVSAGPRVKYRLKLGTTRKSTKQHDPKTLESCIDVQTWDTFQLWDIPPKDSEKPVHLVIMTHGIFSNVGCDMLYMKERIEKAASASHADECNVVVRGCMNNMGKSAHGIRYLGVRLGKYVLKIYEELSRRYTVDKISFVGHSLGGPTQTMAIHYIALKRPDFFEKVQPINFIALASPFLGVANDMPLFVSFGLTIGTFGLTGRDLTLKHTPLTSREGLATTDSDGEKRSLRRPIMEILPLSPAQEVLQKFQHRTLYASVLHDGIVPLRTAALLYLDWRSLAKVGQLRRQQQQQLNRNDKENDATQIDESGASSSPAPQSASTFTSNYNGITGVIPEAPLDKKAAAQFFMPHKLVKYRKYARAQVTDSKNGDGSSDSDDQESTPPGKISKEEAKFNPPREASTVLAALSVLTSPLPTQEYIKDPDSRTDSVVHDRVYHPSELPPPHYQSRPFYKKIIYPNESSNKLQEEIARSWQKSMSWRKVLVDLKPDAHNNIVVRRRFVNLFGNVAVRHMAETHFGGTQA